MNLEEKYNFVILEPTESIDFIGSYLYRNNIKYDTSLFRVEDEVGFDWLPVSKSQNYIKYVLKISEEDAVIISLLFPESKIYKSKPGLPIAEIAKRIIN